MNVYNITPAVLPLDSLDCNYPLVEALNIKPNDFYKQTFNEFYTLADRPFVINDGGKKYVISSREDVLSATEAGVKTMEVFIVEGLEGLSLVRFILHKTQTRRKSAGGITNTIIYLTDYIERDEEARQWADNISRDKKALWSQLLSCSETTIQDYLTIDEFAPELIEEIDSGHISKNQALNAARLRRELIKDKISFTNIKLPDDENDEPDDNDLGSSSDVSAKLFIEDEKKNANGQEQKETVIEDLEITFLFDETGKLSLKLNGSEVPLDDYNESKRKDAKFMRCNLSSKCVVHLGVTGIRELVEKAGKGHQ